MSQVMAVTTSARPEFVVVSNGQAIGRPAYHVFRDDPEHWEKFVAQYGLEGHEVVEFVADPKDGRYQGSVAVSQPAYPWPAYPWPHVNPNASQLPGEWPRRPRRAPWGVPPGKRREVLKQLKDEWDATFGRSAPKPRTIAPQSIPAEQKRQWLSAQKCNWQYKYGLKRWYRWDD
jgi:hypothetical protein